MFSVDTILLTITIAFGFYMAWNIGANDVANAMGTSVGSKALTLAQAVILAAILEFAGAFFVGAHVTDTVRKGMFDPMMFSEDYYDLVYGMMAALLAAGIWLNIATFFGWPVSTSHSIVGAVVGFVLVAKGFDAVEWPKVGSIAASWLVSPILSGSISFIIFTIIRKKIFQAKDQIKATNNAVPVLVFCVCTIMTLVMVFKGLKNLNLDLPFGEALMLSASIGAFFAGICYFAVCRLKDHRFLHGKAAKVEVVKGNEIVTNGLLTVTQQLSTITSQSSESLKKRLHRIETDVKKLIKEAENKSETKYQYSSKEDYRRYTERVFIGLQILSACFIAFAHGANDVANSIGPLAAVIDVLSNKTVAMTVDVPIWILGIGGLGIVIGLATWGYKVIDTIGKKITELTPTRGFTATFGAAITIVFASKLGLPISTTHTLVGAVLGVGMARGVASLDLRVVRDIVSSWVITLPVSAGLAITVYYILKAIF